MNLSMSHTEFSNTPSVQQQQVYICDSHHTGRFVLIFGLYFEAAHHAHEKPADSVTFTNISKTSGLGEAVASRCSQRIDI